MKSKRILCLMAASLLLLSACSGPASTQTTSGDTTAAPNETDASGTTAAETPGNVTVNLPTAARANGVISAEEWSEMFPEIYAS